MHIGPITLNPMSHEDIVKMGPLFIFVFLILFFISRNIIFHHENFVREFYWALSEKYCHSYFTPNKVIKFVRRRFGLRTKRKLHWVVCFYHYLQIAMAISPAFMLIVHIFIPPEYAHLLSFLIGVFPFWLMFIIHIPFALLQWIRCEIIKKTNPLYANREFHDRRDIEYHWGN